MNWGWSVVPSPLKMLLNFDISEIHFFISSKVIYLGILFQQITRSYRLKVFFMQKKA